MLSQTRSGGQSMPNIRKTREEGIRILVVDDEEPVRGVLKSYLEKFDYRTLEATDGKEALRLLETEPVDIVISDNQMPGMSGVELYRRIEERDPQLAGRFLLITGAKHAPEVVGFVRDSKASFLEKPFQLKEISSLVEEMVSQLEETSPAA